MRVPHRAKTRSTHYRLEMIEQRLLLSSAPVVQSLAASANEIKPIIAVPFGKDLGQGSTTQQGIISPAQMRAAYGVNNITFGSVAGTGAGITIGIVDAYDDPNALSDLQAFDVTFGLPDPPLFEKLNQQGVASPLPSTDPTGAGSPNGTWETEESLDIEWAHVIAPGANIILFEADNPSTLDTTAATAARNPIVSVVSMSFGGIEDSTSVGDDADFTTPAGHQPVTFAASAGDSGIYITNTQTIAPQYPASSPNVVAVGGTTLSVAGNSYGGETAWGSGNQSGFFGGGGGGISNVEAQPNYQHFLDTASTTNRTYPDVALDADPNSGVAVYDTFDNGVTTPWQDSPEGGTSLACPMFAGLVAIADQGRALNGLATLDGAGQTLPRIYNLPTADFNDVINGSNGYQAGPGYDLTTGRGSPIANKFVPDLAASYIGSYVFKDTNLDGIQESGETGSAGITVTLKTPGPDGVIGTIDDTIVATTLTDASGLYQFTNIPAATYYVNFSVATGTGFSPRGTSNDPLANSEVTPATGNTSAIVIAAGAGYDLANAGIFTQSISISDVTITRPHTGTAPMVFTVTVSPVNINGLAVPFSTEDGTATVANGDYEANAGVLVFPVGVLTENITVEAIGNTTIENNVSYTVIITPPGGYTGTKPVGTGTILNSNFPAATVTGPAPMTRSALVPIQYPFVITLSATAPFDVSVPYTTFDQSAIAGVDYLAAIGTAVIPAGTTTATVDVTVPAGTNRQLNKTFEFELSTPPAPITETVGSPSVATASILTNALPAVSVDASPSVTESLTGLAYLPFTVEVSPSLTSPFTVQYATSDGTAVAGKDYQAQSGTLSFNSGRIIQTVEVPVYRQFISAQSKTVNFSIFNITSTIQLVSPSTVGTINYLGLSALPFSSAQKAVYTDSLNQRVVVSMKGLGSGDVIFLGGISNATNAYEITTDGTTVASSLTISVARGQQTSLTQLGFAAPIGAVNARTTNITGNVTASGSVNTLNLGYIASATISVGGAGSGQTLALSFNRVLNSSITSAIPIRSLTAQAYVNTTGSPIYITAPSVGVVKVKGNFGGTITTSSVTTLSVGGVIQGGVIASGSIGTVTAGGITDSTFFAGVNSGQLTLPTLTTDFSNTAASIRSVRVTGGVFSDSLISGWTVGNVSAGRVTATAGTKTFGVSASHVGKVRALASATDQVIAVVNPTVEQIFANFVIKPLR